MAEKFLLKNIFTKAMLSYIAYNIKSVHPPFKVKSFFEEVEKGFEHLTFNERAEHIAQTLHLFLPNNYLEAIDIIEQSLGPIIQEEELEGCECFYVMPLSIYVRMYGQNNYDRSMQALKEMTMRFTSEWPIRSFIENNEKKSFEYFHLWAKNENCHVRRLVSEGTRPRLPMGTQLKKYIQSPDRVLDLLEHLKGESTRLVQRSIANSLNDISKDHPKHVISFLKRWKREKVLDIDWIISHACRTLVKEANIEALELLGYEKDIKIKNFSLELVKDTIQIGDCLEFTLTFELDRKSDLIIDFLVYFKKANGSLKAKVFKLSKKCFKQGQVRLDKKHFVKEINTRKYYEGMQALAIQINGRLYEPKKEFFLKI